MTVNDVIAAVEEIEHSKSDSESAHGKEDALYERVLREIAYATWPDEETMRRLAREALRTQEIDFKRWSA